MSHQLTAVFFCTCGPSIKTYYEL